MGYSPNENDVRVDVFRPTGKHFAKFAVNMAGFYEHDSHDALRESLVRYCKESGYVNEVFNAMTAVCLEPYNRYPYPVMVRLSWVDGELQFNSLSFPAGE